MPPKRRKQTWLLKLNPPDKWYPGEPAGELLLWWRTIRQAAHDITHAHQSEALDAWEFMRSTGLWLLIEVFHIPEDTAIKEVVTLVRRAGIFNEKH